MRDKQYINKEIERLDKSILTIKDKTLGQLLRLLQITKIMGKFSYFDHPLQVGMFKFDCYDHDTGIDVRCWVVGEDDNYQIISRTYWKSAGYRSTEDYWKKGVWDRKLEEIIQMFRDKLAEHYKKKKLFILVKN